MRPLDLDLAVPPADIDFDDVAQLQSIVEAWTTPYAATSEMHDVAAYEAVPDDRKVSARGIEVGHIFYFGTKYSEPMRAVVNGPDGQEHVGAYGVIRHRPVAARRRR